MKKKRWERSFFAIAVVVCLLSTLSFSHKAIGNGNQPPNADFHWDPSGDILTDQSVNFYGSDSDDPDGTIIAWQWEFGDGDTSIAENPTHTYTDDGTYDVTLTVIDNNGSTDSITKQITINNRAPTADAGPDQIVNEDTVTFDGSGSTDPDGTIATFSWDFGDGSTGTGETVDHTYADDGNYTVVLNVTDDDGASDTDTTEVTVDTVAPITNVTLAGTEGDNDWYVGNVTVTLTADDNTTDVDATYYKIDDGNWTKYLSSFVVRSEGTTTVRFYSVDDAGNQETVKNITFKIDKSDPKVTISAPEEGYIYIFNHRLLPTIRGNTYAFGRLTIEATVNATPSGVNKVRFLVDGDVQFTDSEAPYTWRWGLAFGGHNVEVKAVDRAGNNATAAQYITIFSLLPGRNEATSSAREFTTDIR